MQKLNQISEELRNEALSYLKDRGKVRFEILGKKIVEGRLACKAMSRILSKDTIYDPVLEKQCDIGYVINYQSAPDGSNRDSIPVFGDIYFYGAEGGYIQCAWDNPGDHELFVFLYLCRWNKSNADKPWHIKPVSNNYTFKMDDPESDARTANQKEEQIVKAKGLIYDLSAAEIFKLHESFFPDQTIEGGSNVLRRKLSAYAQRHPDKILHLHEDEKLQIMQLIKDLERNQIVFYDAQTRYWRRTDGETMICRVGEKDDRYDVFYRALRIEDSLKREMKTYLLTALEGKAKESTSAEAVQ